MPLTYAQARACKTNGFHRVDRGLYVQVRRDGASITWAFRYRRNGRTRFMGFGPLSEVNLTEARDLADDARRALRKGIDPIDQRRADKGEATITFGEATKRFIATHEASWSNPKHRYQVERWLTVYAKSLSALPVDSIESNHVIRCVEPIWRTKTETAERVRFYIGRVLDWAKAAGYRTGDNPAQWKGGLEHRLPAASKVKKVEHHEAVPVDEAPALFAKVGAVKTKVSMALRFIALTAVRTGEALGMTWTEVEGLDGEAPVWVVPASRMKMRKEHRVPLAPAAVAILKAVRGERKHPTGLVFHGSDRTKRISDASLRKLMRKFGSESVTTHGWRSTFRDWAATKTDYPPMVAEASLAHLLGSKTEVAYLRSDLFEQRCGLMGEWGKFLGGARVS